jgi:hypothetical protein
MSGDVTWDENVLRYDYTVKDAERLFEVILENGFK